ncbi:TetR/AcrR family transcriptional regulator [Streptomyces uncialis]|uniref:TetR/AcrR family transcriptional regulator n=1 Tax=Streptomyces uncialis TaxID=1048205 RepID=UPI003658397A
MVTNDSSGTPDTGDSGEGPTSGGTGRSEDAKSGARTARKAVGRPRRIDPARIVATARRILQEEGVDGLSMRRVAREVGTTPMALYHHVRDKDELLMLTLAGMAESVPRPELPDDPRERLLAVTLHMYRTLRQMPWVVEVLSLGDLTDKGALWIVEEALESAVACGLTPDDAVRAYRTLWHCVHGELVFRAAADRRAADPQRVRNFPDALISEADAERLPLITSLADRWVELSESYDLAVQLRKVIDGLLGPRPPARDTGN